MSLVIYGQSPSQPTRAVQWLCELKGIPYVNHKTNVTTPRSVRKEYIDTINPTGRVPAIKDNSNNGFVLYESAAILIYLCDKNGFNDFYPSAQYNLNRKALIDQYLHWHHENIRFLTLGFYYFYFVFCSLFFLKNVFVFFFSQNRNYKKKRHRVHFLYSKG